MSGHHRPHPRRRARPASPTALAVTASIALSGCFTKTYQLDLTSYPKLPAARITKAMRCAVETCECLRTRALWGNYGGPGCSGGEPCDPMDELFLEHDLAYLQGTTRAELIEADRVLIEQLRALDESTLTPEARRYRDRAIRYFSRPISRVLGKPPDVLLGIKRQPTIVDTSVVRDPPHAASRTRAGAKP